MKKTIILTGGCGHLGGHIAKELSEAGYKLRFLVLPKDDCPMLNQVPGERYIGDVRDKNSLLPLFQGLEPKNTLVVHAAGLVSIRQGTKKRLFDVNVTGTRNLAQASLAAGVSCFLYVSSVHAITEKKPPEVIRETKVFDASLVRGAYAKSKALATKEVQKAGNQGLPWIVVHPSGIIGPNDPGPGHTTQLIIDFLNGRLKATVRGGYDFVDVRDVAKGIRLALEKGHLQEGYILSNRYCGVKELTLLLETFSGVQAPQCILPYGMVLALAPFFELWARLRKSPPLFTRYSVQTLRHPCRFSHQKATDELGYHPRPIEETLQATICDLKER